MKILMTLVTSLIFNSAWATVKISDDKVCGALIYTQGNYILKADHQDNYIVRADKLDKDSLRTTSLMRVIIENHNYDESDSPQVCFYGVQSEQVGTNELDVLEVTDVQPREFLN